MTPALLASVLPAAPQAGPARAGHAKSDAAADNGEFADCMEQARGAASPEAHPVEASDEATTPPADVASTADAEAAPATNPDLAALLPGWGTPPPTPLTAATTAATAAAPADAADALAAVAAGNGAALAAAPQRVAPARADTLRAVPATPATPATPAAPAASAHSDAAALPIATANTQTPGDARNATADAALPATPATPALPATPSVHATAPRAAESAATPISAQIAAAIDTPAFAPALATQVRWWANDGVQHAQLTLNPPEMGPVAVKIVVFDGREARIDFSADLAATRSAIEAALPVLAAALDDSGLKLSGGGVHDGAAQRQLPWQAQGTPSRGAPAREGEHTFTDAPGTRPAGPARGLVDLVA
jgi:flagellar hook-length control protein FliK